MSLTHTPQHICIYLELWSLQGWHLPASSIWIFHLSSPLPKALLQAPGELAVSPPPQVTNHERGGVDIPGGSL